MVSDQETTISHLRDHVRQFVAERDWEKFHSPKNISMAMSIEVAELMEHFQWLSEDESRSPDDDTLVEISEEVSDVFCYLMALANSLNIDLTSSFNRKMEKNRSKYPVEKFRGRFGANDPNPVQLAGLNNASMNSDDQCKETNDA